MSNIKGVDGPQHVSPTRIVERMEVGSVRIHSPQKICKDHHHFREYPFLEYSLIIFYSI